MTSLTGAAAGDVISPYLWRLRGEGVRYRKDVLFPRMMGVNGGRASEGSEKEPLRDTVSGGGCWISAGSHGFPCPRARSAECSRPPWTGARASEGQSTPTRGRDRLAPGSSLHLTPGRNDQSGDRVALSVLSAPSQGAFKGKLDDESREAERGRRCQGARLAH